MAGTTTNFAIPYPTATDYVTDGATAMKSLADQVDAAMFTGASAGNLLINGAMQVTQRSAVGTAVTGKTTADYYIADRWRTDINSLGTWSLTTNNDAPTGSGFRNSFKLACTTADASPAAGDYLVVQQKIEGQNLQAIRKGTASAQTLTLSFWVASFQTGTFIVELEDVDNSRSCSKAYSVSASNTWEYKTVTFPADTTGVLDNDSNQSLVLNFWLGAGTTYTSGTLQTTWGTTTNANRCVGVTNLASSTSNRWNMTGAQLTVGSVATPFEFKSFGDELRACQRYYEKSYVQGVTPGTNDSNGLVLGQSSTGGDSYWYFQIEYKVTKRTKDVTATFYNSTGATSLWSWGRSGSSGNNLPAIQYASDNWLQIYIYGGAAWVPMQAVGHYAVSAEL
jgi:hypothetical protein